MVCVEDDDSNGLFVRGGLLGQQLTLLLYTLTGSDRGTILGPNSGGCTRWVHKSMTIIPPEDSMSVSKQHLSLSQQCLYMYEEGLYVFKHYMYTSNLPGCV